MSSKTPSGNSLELRVRITQANEIKAADYCGTSDPYLIVRIGNNFERTKTVKKTLNPQWNEDFVFYLEPNPDNKKEPLVNMAFLELWDQDSFSKDDIMGRGSFGFANLQASKAKTEWYTLNHNDGTLAGKVEMSLTAINWGEPKTTIAKPVTSSAYPPPPPGTTSSAQPDGPNPFGAFSS
eukprot:TRINITY_DN5166_c0_g1_i1.p1 TRINITY_DN5166_c0_g1~~TRINITY_DN5166_c0_g1_i1.p1  ORF type:complete len:180 (+),score=53.54 TRINITY_DN5166_c0_g1_i1:51-590(+)